MTSAEHIRGGDLSIVHRDRGCLSAAPRRPETLPQFREPCGAGLLPAVPPLRSAGALLLRSPPLTQEFKMEGGGAEPATPQILPPLTSCPYPNGGMASRPPEFASAPFGTLPPTPILPFPLAGCQPRDVVRSWWVRSCPGVGPVSPKLSHLLPFTLPLGMLSGVQKCQFQKCQFKTFRRDHLRK